MNSSIYFLIGMGQDPNPAKCGDKNWIRPDPKVGFVHWPDPDGSESRISPNPKIL